MKHALNFKLSWACILMTMVIGTSQLGFSQGVTLSEFDKLRNLGWELEDQNQLDSALIYYQKAENIAAAEGDQSKHATILNDMAIVSRKKSDYVACKNYHLKASDIAFKSKDYEMVEISLHGLGTLYELTGDFDEAIACYLRTLQLTLERGDQAGAIITRQNLSKTYMRLHFKDAAMKHIESAYQSSVLLKNDSLCANVLHDYAEVLLHFKEYGLALSKMESALASYQKIGYRRYIGSSLVYLGDIHAQIGQKENAFANFEKALIYADQMDGDVLADLYLKMGGYYREKGDVNTAKHYYTKGYDYAKTNGFRTIEQIGSWNLYQLSEQSKDEAEALAYLKEAYMLKDNLYNIEKTGRVAELQLKYDNEKQLRKMHAMELKQNRYLMFGSILFLLGIIGALAYYSRLKTRNHEVLEQKNKEIESQNRQLAEHIAVLRQYSYAAAHDLKEPLRTITSFINLLEKKYIGSIAEPEAKEYMQFISNSARRMNLLLTDLLEYNSILSQEAGSDSAHPKELIQDVWSSLSALVHDKNAEISIPDNMPTMIMNRFHFTQLFQNLISNGLKFTKDRDAKIDIQYERKDDHLIFSVRDNGIGINEQYRDKIFQMFYRLNDLKSAEGTGIGLTIVKNITEKYKGRIWFKSVEGEGTTFFISFPATMLAENKEAQRNQDYSRSVAAATF